MIDTPLRGDADTTAASITTTTTQKTETVVAPPKQVSVVLATMTAFWDWFDSRRIEQHLVAFFTLAISYMALKWSMHYADVNEARSGTDIAAIIAAISVPVATFQGAVIKWYFEAHD